MQVNRINNTNTHFQARFVRNEDIIKLTKKQIDCGNGDVLEKALEDLGNIKRNVYLEFKQSSGMNFIQNLYNKKTIHWESSNKDAEKIIDLSNPSSQMYKDLFLANTKENLTQRVNAIASKYFSDKNEVPDYTLFNN